MDNGINRTSGERALFPDETHIQFGFHIKKFQAPRKHRVPGTLLWLFCASEPLIDHTGLTDNLQLSRSKTDLAG